MRRGVLYAFFLISHEMSDYKLKSAMFDAAKAFGITTSAVDKAVRDELKRAGLKFTTKEYVEYCRRADIKLPFIN